MEIKRIKELGLLKERFKNLPAVAILGPRQCGKTTLARQFASQHSVSKTHFFDLEYPADLAKLENPTLAIEHLNGTVVIDEVQRKPELFPVLRAIIDRHPSLKFLILGSASRDLLKQSSESLAGRISYLEMGGFTLDHLSPDESQRLWTRGGFPRSYLAGSAESSYQWRLDFVTTFLEKDIPNLGIRIPPKTLRKFWMMLSHYHGQIFNASEIGRSLAATDATVKRYLDILSGTFLVRQIQPWFYNTKKRLVKRPKIYFRDSGILHALLAVKDIEDLSSHPKLGASWEGFAIEQAIQHLNLKEDEVFFWAVHTGAELDLVFTHRGKLWGVEAKYDEAPKISASMRSALSELKLSHLWVIYPGKQSYALDELVTAIPITDISLTTSNASTQILKD